MSLSIRLANENDTKTIMKLLHEVLEVHAALRPDLFISGTTKYTEDELKTIIADSENRPIFVADEGGEVLGYAFCVIIRSNGTNNSPACKTLYIDDLCVDENTRGKHVASSLYSYVKNYAKEIGCYNLTLNVWEGNDARKFYDKMGLNVRCTTMEAIL